MKTNVEILVCPSCGAPVPLGTGEVSRCVHCRTEVPLPEAHRELRRLGAAEQTQRREAEEIFARLDRPPPLLVKVLAAVLDLSMLPFLMVYGIPLRSDGFSVRTASAACRASRDGETCSASPARRACRRIRRRR